MAEPLILTVLGNAPQIHHESWVAPNAAVVGRVTLAEKVGVWYSATLRAEFEDCEVTIGRGTTTLRTELPDRGALSGLMERINSLGLDVIDVSLVAPPPGRLAPRSPIEG